MVQGNRKPFQHDFYKIKEGAQQEKLTPGDDPSILSRSGHTPSSKAQQMSSPKKRIIPSELSRSKNSTAPALMREIELVELKQKFNTFQTDHHNNIHSTRPRKLKRERDVSSVWAVVIKLPQDGGKNEQLMREQSLPQEKPTE